ncbi:hypothetical protein BGI32_10855 [Snodgrassella alvi]|uniref:Uncharacterized protein n=1 Tax=Snodgrassella alvi TaxID=1196083 RepID=A0A2N9WRD3_9NEIS|nr:hypothetical protein [Snodgrassella alvi]PIT12679.1 hypothetical protein BGI32_10855 [Snodgrassella alvi]
MTQNNDNMPISKLFLQYQLFGYNIMAYLSKSLANATLGKIDHQAINNIDGCYQKIIFPDQTSIRYTTWRNGRPFYIILFNPQNEYLFELDLSRLVCIENRFTWYLAIPTNPDSRKILTDTLEQMQLPFDYMVWVEAQKIMLKQGKEVFKEGFLFLEDNNWDELLEKLAVLIQAVMRKHNIANYG